MAMASGGGSNANSDIEGDILDVQEMLEECDEENWLVESEAPAEAFALALSPSNEAIFLSKKSLVNKLDHIAKGEIRHHFDSGTVYNNHRQLMTYCQGF